MKQFLVGMMLAVFSIGIFAQEWRPTGPVQIIVPWPIGGTADVGARIIAAGLNDRGIEAVVINKPGGGGSIGVAQLRSSKPDGQTLMLTPTSFVFNKILKQPGTDYDIENDFKHIGLFGFAHYSLFARSSLPYNNFQQLAPDLKNNKRLTIGTGAPTSELVVAQLKDNFKNTNLELVKYAGSTPAITALMGGHIDLVVDADASSTARAGVDSGKIKRIASFNLKDKDPAAIDRQVPGVVLRGWYGLSLPAGTDDRIARFYENQLSSLLNDPRTRGRLYVAGIDPHFLNSKEFVNLMQADTSKYNKLANKIGQ